MRFSSGNSQSIADFVEEDAREGVADFRALLGFQPLEIGRHWDLCSSGLRSVISVGQHRHMPIAPSSRTRRLFREHLVNTTLGYIDDVFGGVGLLPAEVPPERLPGGQRRGLVEEYYAGVDWESAPAIGKVLSAYEQILFDIENAQRRERLTRSLRLDGFVVDDSGRVSPPAALDLGIEAGLLDDAQALRGYERRILENINDDPELAIGSSKELVEAVARLLLDEAGVEADPNWSAERLFKEALKTLDLSIENIDDARAGADSIRKVLRSLHQTVVGTAELRNRFGTGHGRHRRSGLGPRHARLVGGAALALARFLLDTRTERRQT